MKTEKIWYNCYGNRFPLVYKMNSFSIRIFFSKRILTKKLIFTPEWDRVCTCFWFFILSRPSLHNVMFDYKKCFAIIEGPGFVNLSSSVPSKTLDVYLDRRNVTWWLQMDETIHHDSKRLSAISVLRRWHT